MGYTKLVSILKEGVGAGTPSLGLISLPINVVPTLFPSPVLCGVSGNNHFID